MEHPAAAEGCEGSAQPAAPPHMLGTFEAQKRSGVQRDGPGHAPAQGRLQGVHQEPELSHPSEEWSIN